MIVPQCNPKASYLAHKEEIDAAIQDVLDSGVFLKGKQTEAFEREFADYIGVKYAVAVGNGTDALEIALRACGVGVGDAVYAPSLTAVATIAAIERTGATPVFVDVDNENTYTMNMDSLNAAIELTTDLTRKAIVPVHLYGIPCDMSSICLIADENELIIVEDCAQSHGAKHWGETVGSFGKASSFSFYPTKLLSCLGDGGMVLTDDVTVMCEARMVSQYGWRGKSRDSDIKGFNSRMDEIHAATLRIKLKYLDDEIKRRSEIAQLYTEAMGERFYSSAECVNYLAQHQFVVRIMHNRDGFAEYLSCHGIGFGIHYPVPVHLQPAYTENPLVVPLTHTEEICNQVISMPMFPEMTEAQINAVCEALRHLGDYR